MPQPFSFNEAQFNRLFPFYLLINRELKITSMGKSMSKLFDLKNDVPFNNLFSIPRPYTPITDFNSLLSLQNQLVAMEAVLPQKLLLRGQLEYLAPSDELLFIGSPWFDSIEQVTERKLVIVDFAYHDPLIDLLHVLKSQEITNQDLKQLLSTINKQKKDLQRANKEVHDIALFPTQNPDPVVRINFNGEIIRNNLVSAQLDFFELDNKVYRNDEFFKLVAERIDKSNSRWIIEAKSKNRDYSFVCVSMVEEGYINIYGRDITQQKKDRESLKVLSQIAEDNINAVVIADKEGRITWVNKSFVKMTGYSLDEAIGKKPGHFLQGPETDKKTIDYLRKQIETGVRFDTKIINYSKGGNKYWTRLQGQPIKNEAGEVTGFFAVQENITIEKESESRFWKALENIGDNVWEHDFRTGKTYFSKSENEFLGLQANETENIDELWWKSVLDEDRHLLIASDNKYRNAEIDSHSMEYRIRHSSGSIKWVLDRGVVIEKDRKGHPMRLTGTHTDITNIKTTETELANRVKQFQSLSENIPGVIFEYEFRNDGTNGIRYISPAIERIFGIKQDKFKNYLTYIHPDDREMVIQKNQYSYRTLEPFYCESRLIVPGHGTFWHSVSSAFSYNAENGNIVYTGVIFDITTRKNAEEKIKAQEKKFQSIIASMNMGLLEVDNDDIITFANQAFSDMSGYAISELLGAKAGNLLMTVEKRHIIESKNSLRKEGISDAYECQVVDKSGNLKWLFISGGPRYNDEGVAVGSIGIHLDVSYQKNLEKVLTEAKKEAVNLAKSRESFLASMSHEIRTPLNAIIGMVRELKLTTLNHDQKILIRHADASSVHLLSLLNNILDLSKTTSGNLQLDRTSFNLNALFNEVNTIMRQLVIEKLLDITFELPPALNTNYFGDPGRIRQVLINIIGNAIKFTDKGGIRVTCVIDEDEERNNFHSVTITVADTGIGMDAKFLAVIYNSFSQENSGTYSKHGGSGLGMALTKQLVELMNGQIDVSSQKGVGTTVTIRISLEKCEECQRFESQVFDYSHIFEGKQILLVEDNEMNRLVATSMLVRHGMIVTEAENGAVAVDMLSKSSFDLILMDVQMPMMDGIEATTLIREQGISTPIIALTANAFKAEIDRCLAAGMNDIASKPYEETVLLNKLLQALNFKIQLPAAGNTEKKLQDNIANLLGKNSDGPEINYINLDYINKIAPDNEAFRNELFMIFLNQSTQFLEKARQHQIDKKYFELSTLAHQFKPQGAYLGVESLSKIIGDIEYEAYHEKKDEILTSLLNQASIIIEGVNKEIKKRMAILS